MAERDRFDIDLRAALRAFAEDAPTDVRPVELARRIALEHPRGRTVVPPWRSADLPRLAWALLLVGLLLALGAGALMVASRLARSVPAVIPPIGQTYACPPGSTPDEPGPVDQARPPDSQSAIAFDRRAGRLVAVIAVEPVETWTFEVCTNTWTQMDPNREPSNVEWAQSVYDVDSDVTILVSPQAVWTYDLTADTWSEKRAAPTIDPVFLAYDPVSGLVVAGEYSDRKLMWTYEVESDTWTQIDRANAGPSQEAVIAYDASVDRLIAYADGLAGGPAYETWLFDLRTGTWSRSAAVRPAVVGWLSAPGIVYDEAAKRSLIFDRAPLTTYDATADRWETLADRPYPAPTVYDPVNRRLLGWGGGGNDLPGGTVVALDLVTGEWTVLLEPSATPASAARPDEALVVELAALMSNPFDAGAVAALYAPDAVVRDLVEGLTQTGLEEIGARIRYLNTRDFKVVVTSAPIRQDDFVAHFVKFGAGEAAFPGLVVYELKDGKVVNQWVYPTP